MSERKFEKFTDPRGGTALGVRVITRSSATEVAGKSEDGAVRIKLIAAPAGNPEANKELIDFLAAKLGVGPEKIEIVAGLEKSLKMVSIEGISSDDLETKLFS